MKNGSFRTPWDKCLSECFNCSFSIELNIPTILSYTLHCCYLKEPASLLVGWLWTHRWGQQPVVGRLEGPLGSGSHRGRRCLISFFRHLSWGKNGRPCGETPLNCFPGEVPFAFCLWATLLWDFSLLIPKTKGSPWSGEKPSRIPKCGPSREDFSVPHSLSAQIHRYLIGKYTEALVGISWLKKNILVKNLHSCKKKQSLRSSCHETQGLCPNRQE